MMTGFPSSASSVMVVCLPVITSVIGTVIHDDSFPDPVICEDDEVLDDVMVWLLVSEVVQPAESMIARRQSTKTRILGAVRCIYRVRNLQDNSLLNVYMVFIRFLND